MATRPEDEAPVGCPDEDRLAGLLEGTVSEQERSSIQEHVADCPSCRELLAAAARGLAVSDAPAGSLGHAETHWTGSSDDGASVPATLRNGATVGRYVVLGLVGVGAMGSVYAAYDPELDRKIALKMIHASASTESELELLETRLLREAQAMARLSHPAVVPIYDAALVGDEIFVAMEYVEGTNLREWLREGPHPMTEVLAVFRQAGEGLAAAHAAGIVHRDFKPENVLLGKDGRARVADFGLARTGPAEAAVDEEGSRDLALQSAASVTITRTGSLLGTPAYMAPEQMAGEAVGPAADQFSFCVALYEALGGVRPFAGDHLGELYRNICEERVREPRGGSRVPSPVRRALLRGLRARPEERHPTMEGLLQQIRKGFRARRRRVAAVAAVAVLAIAAFAIHRVATGESPALCAGAEAELAQVWNAERAKAVRASFLSTGKPYAAKVFETVKRRLRDYARAWIAEHTAACRATRVAGHQSEALMDRRIHCLREHRHQLRAVARLFSRADKQVIDKAVEAADGLASLSRCRPEVLQRSRLRPPAEENRRRVDELRAALADVEVSIAATGRYRRILPRAVKLEAATRKLGYAPVHAEALALLAKLQRRLRDLRAAKASYTEALHVAASSGHDHVMLRIFLGRAWIAAALERKLPEADDFVRHAGDLVAVVGDPKLRSDLLYIQGVMAFQRGHRATSQRSFERSLALRRTEFGQESVKTVPSLAALGRLARAQRRLREARSYAEHAVDLLVASYGPDHPRLATLYFQLSTVHWRDAGNYERAADLLRRAMALERRSRGPKSPELAQDQARLGHVLAHQGRYPEAQRMIEESLAIMEKVLGPWHTKTGWVLLRLGTVLSLRGRWAPARRAFARATRIWERVHGRDFRALSRPLSGEALALQRLGRPPAEALAKMRRAVDIAQGGSKTPTVGGFGALRRMCQLLLLQAKPKEALASCNRALAMQEKLLPKAHPEIARTLSVTGEVLFALRRFAEARPVLDRALALLEPKKVHLGSLARARLTMAKVLEALGADRDRSRRLAASARALLARLEGAGAKRK